MHLIVKTISNVNSFNGKAPLNTSANKWGRGGALAIGATNDLSFYSTTNHGLLLAPPSPMVNVALLITDCAPLVLIRLII